MKDRKWYAAATDGQTVILVARNLTREEAGRQATEWFMRPDVIAVAVDDQEAPSAEVAA